jgi:hypothetical protein
LDLPTLKLYNGKKPELGEETAYGQLWKHVRYRNIHVGFGTRGMNPISEGLPAWKSVCFSASLNPYSLEMRDTFITIFEEVVTDWLREKCISV